jgi:hypothetical protein
LLENDLKKRRTGRPKSDVLDSLRAKSWYWNVVTLSNAYSGYELEGQFSNEKHLWLNGTKKRPCKFDKYRRGEHQPSKQLVAEAGRKYPYTLYLNGHAFWKIAKKPIRSIEELYICLESLRPEISSLLFETSDHKLKHRVKSSYKYVTIFNKLAKEGDIDALAACIGMIQEISLYMNRTPIGLEFVIADAFLKIYQRVASVPPFVYVADELFQYLIHAFLQTTPGFQLEFKINKLGLSRYLYHSQLRILLIAKLKLLRSFPICPTACLNVAERYLTPQILTQLLVSNQEAISKNPEIRRLSRALRKWERRLTH